MPLWRQIIANALDQAVEVADVREPGCLGAALLAGLGIGVYQDMPEALRRSVRMVARSAPDEPTAALYRERRAAFNDVYQALEARLYH
jgi:sugar (pentulose or hexulose) kinase